MAVEWKTYLHCDVCGAEISLYAAEGGFPGWPTKPEGKREIRKYARELGWVRRYGYDLCVEHEGMIRREVLDRVNA